MSINSDITAFYVNIYNKRKEYGKIYIPNNSVAKECMIKIYNQFIKEGELTPIEEISHEEKQELVKECREVKDVIYDNKTLITSAKILHLIRLINSNT